MVERLSAQSEALLAVIDAEWEPELEAAVLAIISDVEFDAQPAAEMLGLLAVGQIDDFIDLFLTTLPSAVETHVAAAQAVLAKIRNEASRVAAADLNLAVRQEVFLKDKRFLRSLLEDFGNVAHVVARSVLTPGQIMESLREYVGLTEKVALQIHRAYLLALEANPLSVARRIRRDRTRRAKEQRAKVIARTEATRARIQAKIDRWVAASNDVPLGFHQHLEWEWIVVRDEDLCAWCAPMAGKTVIAGAKFVSDRHATSFRSDRTPRYTRGHDPVIVEGPPLHPNCRCDLRPIVTIGVTKHAAPIHPGTGTDQSVHGGGGEAAVVVTDNWNSRLAAVVMGEALPGPHQRWNENISWIQDAPLADLIQWSPDSQTSVFAAPLRKAFKEAAELVAAALPASIVELIGPINITSFNNADDINGWFDDQAVLVDWPSLSDTEWPVGAPAAYNWPINEMIVHSEAFGIMDGALESMGIYAHSGPYPTHVAVEYAMAHDDDERRAALMRGIAVHEIGHAVEFRLFTEKHPDWEWGNPEPPTFDWVHDWDEMPEPISDYATANEHEWFAELFSDVVLSGGSPGHPESKDLLSLLEHEAKRPATADQQEWLKDWYVSRYVAAED